MEFGKIQGIEKKISKLIIGNDYFKNKKKAEKLWDFYYEMGGNTFDNSIYYQNGLNEKLLGEWINKNNIEKKIVNISKIGDENTTPEEYLNLLKISLERLKLNCIDILILHRDNPKIPIDEIINSLNDLIKLGLINSFGISNVSIDRIIESEEFIEKKQFKSFSIINNNLSLAKMIKPLWKNCVSSNEDKYLKLLNQNNFSHFSWSSQARGYFIEDSFIKKLFRNKKNDDLKRCFESKENLLRKKRSMELAKKYNCSSNDIALSWVLNQKFPSYAIIGPKTINQLRFSLNSLRVKVNLNELKWLNLDYENLSNRF